MGIFRPLSGSNTGDRLFNSDGKPLVEVEPGLWIPEECVYTDAEALEYYARFAHPKFSAVKITLNILFPLLFAAGLAALLYYVTPLLLWHSVLTAAGALILYALIRIRALAIFTVRLYQRFAPMNTREKCVYTPTCSDYMILAIKKYGFLRGAIKGRRRYKSCKYPNGGEDYP